MRRSFILFILCVLFCFPDVTGQVPVSTAAAPVQSRGYHSVTGILGAFPDEIRFLLTQLQQKKEHIIQSLVFTEGILQGRRVVVAQSGIGKVNASVTTILMIEHFQPQQIIFTGIAGGIATALSPGDLVIGTHILHHDYGTLTPDSMHWRATRNPTTMMENPLYFPCDPALVELSDEAGKSLAWDKIKTSSGDRIPNVVRGVIITGDVFVASGKAVEVFRSKLNAAATEMEGAAVAQVCWQQKQPFVIIRSISDHANNSASDDIRNFYRIAAHNSASLVMAIVKKLAQEKSKANSSK